MGPLKDSFPSVEATMGTATTSGIESLRSVVRVVRGQVTSDGAGVKLTRVIGNSSLGDLDPFLMLDEFGSDSATDYIAGFPDHPHRGFETVTYMLDGRMRHWDNKGNSGLLGPGSVQWMTAGSGLVHSEMPEQQEGLMRGFQLWINLPAKDKMTPPRYQDIPPEQVPEVSGGEGVTVRLLAGSLNGVSGPVTGVVTDPVYFDVHLAPGATFSVPLPVDHTAFFYVYEGGVVSGADRKKVARGDLAILGKGGHVAMEAGTEPTRLILLAGRPLKEPVARYGPFVMNTREEIMQAFDDFNAGRF
jgi:redox-sensitive bicupin YhaK (pirin superfamily)